MKPFSVKYYIYGRPNCEWCDKAKALLEDKKEPYKYFDIMTGWEAREFFTMAGFKKVPQIYYEDKYIGGYNDLAAHFRKML